MPNGVVKKLVARLSTRLVTRHNAAMLLAAFYLVPASAQTAAPLLPVTPPSIPVAVQAHIAIGDKPAIMYDGLSTRANKLFILSRFQPLEILVKLDKWTKVREIDGAVGWVENTALPDRRFVQIAANVAEVRAGAMATSPLVFEAQRGVLLEVAGAVIDGWLPVRHRDGQSGFVRMAQVWGN